MPGRVRRLVLPFPPADVELLQELLPETEWHVPQRGTARRWLDLADQNARHLMESLRIESFETDERAGDPVYALGRDLGLNSVPRSMICVDISTNQGRDTVGSLVWFEAGRPKKSEYRKFKIKGIGQQDDFAAIHEVVTRYSDPAADEKKPLPDLIVIDGGKGQLSCGAGGRHGPRVAAAPHGQSGQEGGGGVLPRAALRACGSRGAVHRCGCCSASGMRPIASASPTTGKRRTARTITSALLDIPGVGPTRRRLLLERFGSLAGVKSATAYRDRDPPRILYQACGADSQLLSPRVADASSEAGAYLTAMSRAFVKEDQDEVPIATSFPLGMIPAIPKPPPGLCSRAPTRETHSGQNRRPDIAGAIRRSSLTSNRSSNTPARRSDDRLEQLAERFLRA